MAKLKVGDLVKFYPSHNKMLTLQGEVTKLHTDGRSVDIEVEPDGKIVEVEGHMETANMNDCELLEAQRGQGGPPARGPQKGKDKD